MAKTKLENTKNKSSWGGKRPGSGRKKGSQNKATKERKAVEDEFKQRVMYATDRLFNAQLALAEGTVQIYRLEEYTTTDENGKKIKKKRHVLVTDPDEIIEFLDADIGEAGVVGEHFYYVAHQRPDNKAIDSLLNRIFGKPVQPLAGHDGGPLFDIDDETREKARKARAEILGGGDSRTRKS